MIDRELYRRLSAELAEIGRTPAGWNRIAWGPREDEARSWFSHAARGLALDVLQDPAGNLWAFEPGCGAGPWDCAGSHVDTVGNGGAFDGALGVVCALTAVAAVRRGSRQAPRPLAVACMVDEEGPRFSSAIFGSRALAGEWDLDELLERRDAEGLRLADLAATRGVTRSTLEAAPGFRSRIASFVEVHIEQGRHLVDVPSALGVATALAPRERWLCTLAGASDHAGTTPMEGRHDALVAAARLVLAAHENASAEAGAVATVGRLDVHPGSSNVIPGEVLLSLDVRARESSRLERVREAIRATPLGEVSASWHLAASDAGCEFDRGLRQRLMAAASAEGTTASDLAAYAGHDAGVLARSLPAAMLFVRNPTGISHNPAEHADEEDCLAACAVLARMLAGAPVTSVR